MKIALKKSNVIGILLKIARGNLGHILKLMKMENVNIFGIIQQDIKMIKYLCLLISLYPSLTFADRFTALLDEFINFKCHQVSQILESSSDPEKTAYLHGRLDAYHDVAFFSNYFLRINTELKYKPEEDIEINIDEDEEVLP
jgi:hypothetical protein